MLEAKRAAQREASRRYHSTHQRIEYAPAPPVLEAIERHLAGGLDSCRAGVLDALILAGDRAITGKGE